MKLNGRWFPQIVDQDSGNLYPIYPPFPCSGGVIFDRDIDTSPRIESQPPMA